MFLDDINDIQGGEVQILTLGTLSALQQPSDRSLSRISQAKMLGHSLLQSEILLTTPGVATRGFDPPMALGLIDPVSQYLNIRVKSQILKDIIVVNLLTFQEFWRRIHWTLEESWKCHKVLLLDGPTPRSSDGLSQEGVFH